MADELTNGFLRDGATATILPSTRDVREGWGISWYEVQLVPAQKKMRLIAFGPEGDRLGTAETTLVSEHELKLVISDRGVDLDSTLRLDPDRPGAAKIAGRFNGQELSIANGVADRRTDLHIPMHWNSLMDPLVSLAGALKARAVDSRSWGCTSCLVLGGAVALGAALCCEGALTACVGALSGGAGIIENCGGSCA